MQPKRCPKWPAVCRFLLAVVVLFVGSGGDQVVRAQFAERRNAPQLIEHLNAADSSPLTAQEAVPEATRSHALATEGPAPVSVPSSPPHFGDALVGSLIGTALAMPLGVVMIRGASNDEVWEAQEARSEECCGLQRLGLGLGGVAVAVAGGPYGAARRLDRNGVPLYGASVSGEVLLGGLGYVLGSVLGGDEDSVVGGLAVGVPLAALGAAGGAVLGSLGSFRERRPGGLRFRDGEWSVQMPDVRVRPNLRTDRRPVVRVTLFSAQID